VANKRTPSQQQRARENRAKREALKARTGQGPARPSRLAPSTAEKLANRPAADDGSGTKGAKGAKGSTKAAPARARRPKPGDTPVDLDTLEGSWFSKVTRVPGGAQVLMAAAMSVVVTGMMSLMPLFVAEEDQDDKKAKATQTIFERYPTGRALLILAVPLAIVAIALALSLTKQRRRAWIACALVLGFFVAMQVPFYLFPAGFLGYAWFRANKIEGPEPFFGGRRRGGRAADDDEAVADEDDAAASEPAKGSQPTGSGGSTRRIARRRITVDEEYVEEIDG